MGCPGTRAPVWPPAPVTSLELTLVCDSSLHNCNMGFPWLRVLLRDKNDCSDFYPDLVSASRCTCSLQGPLGTPVVHGPEPAGVASPSSRALQALGGPRGQRGLWEACAVPLSLDPRPAVLLEGCVGGHASLSPPDVLLCLPRLWKPKGREPPWLCVPSSETVMLRTRCRMPGPEWGPCATRTRGGGSVQPVHEHFRVLCDCTFLVVLACSSVLYN